MHAARLINNKRKNSRSGSYCSTRSSIYEKKDGSNDNIRNTVNTWYLEKLDKRRAAAVIARRKARGVNLSVLFFILAIIGGVFIIIGNVIYVPGLLETGIFALVIGTIFAICCHFENTEMVGIDEPLDSVVVSPHVPSSSHASPVHKGGGEIVESTTHSKHEDQNPNELLEVINSGSANHHHSHSEVQEDHEVENKDNRGSVPRSPFWPSSPIFDTIMEEEGENISLNDEEETKT